MLDGADMIGPEFRVHVDGGDTLVIARSARGVGRGEGGAALFQVPGFITALGGAGNGQREDAVGVSVAVARVRVSAAVARGPDEDGAFAFTTLVVEMCIWWILVV